MFKFLRKLAPAPPTPEARIAAAIRCGAFDEAATLVDALLADALCTPQQRAFALNKRGVICARRGDSAGAQAAFDAVLEAQPRDPAALTNLGNLALERGEYGAALERYDAAIAADEQYANAYHNRSIALKALGRVAEAVAARRTEARMEGRLGRKQRKLF